MAVTTTPPAAAPTAPTAPDAPVALDAPVLFGPVGQAAILITDLLNGQTWGYAAVHDLLGAGTSVNMSSFPRSIFQVVNNTSTALPINVPNGPQVTAAANGGSAVLSTHSNIAPGKSVVGKAGAGGAVQGYRFS
jgi:hypothetical protein